MPARQAVELSPGDCVIGPDGEIEFEVRAVEQHQGKMQVVDTNGGAHHYWPNTSVSVRNGRRAGGLLPRTDPDPTRQPERSP
jgi:hypothetical protein